MTVRHATNSIVLFDLILFTLLSSASAQTHWVGSWTASQQVPEPRNALAVDDVRDTTLRQIVHLSIGGSELRVHISNRYGTTSLHLTAAHVAEPLSPALPKIIAGSDKALTFGGASDVTIPAAAEYISDPVRFDAAPLSDLAITIHIDQPPTQQTGHPGSRSTSYLVHGDQVAALDLPGAKTFEHWYFISGVDVAATSQANAIVILGDSITDGHGATTNGNDRWPDLLATRLQGEAATKSVAVLNAGIGGNRVLLDELGPNALARFNDDAVAPAGVRYLIVLEGVNDLGMMTRLSDVTPAEHQTEVHRMIGAYEQMILRAHAHGIEAIGGAIMPFVGPGYYHPGPNTEADRQAINDWIRAPGHFDAVIDFDKITRDPQHPDRLLPAYDSGDHLHPSHAGYAAMAGAVPLSLFATRDPAPQIAFTFDDLPAHGPLPPNETRTQIASKIIAALSQAHMPPTYGFVNGLDLEKHPEDIEVLKAWRVAGNPLGNHSWSHMNLGQTSLDEFEADVTRDEPLVSPLMEGGDWHWFRFPFLVEGDMPEKRSGFRRFLQQHGYKVAGVTMSFADYLFNEPYARCKSKNDDRAIEQLESMYLEAADQSIDYYRGLSHTLYGHDIRYVLLMHIGALDAEMLPRLLELYRSRGFQFITLPEAEKDEFYREDTDLSLPPGADMLEGAMAERHLPLPQRPDIAGKLNAMCR